ncbi:MAG: anti-sigma F factor [Clostridiales bacterium]|jgi:stage II sporulation protein AB (anti-sigma F factor)|nr:anti-sigma F factor [Clostridiales bacterium]
MDNKMKEQSGNKMTLIVPALSVNEAFVRSAVAAFAVQLDPTVDEINDVKTAVSEAVTNSIVHGYDGKGGEITVRCEIAGGGLHIEVSDAGVGIPDVARAREMFFTTKPEQERSGMGFAIMETFMDGLDIRSEPGKGTTVTMSKVIKRDA